MACFFVVVNRVLEARADLGIDDGAFGARRVDRYDDETCDGENPRTTLVVLLSDVALESAVVDSCDLWDDDGETEAACGSGSGAVMIGAAVLLSLGEILLASGARYECVLIPNGSKSFFSLIVMTIFSRSSGVICLSFPRLRLLQPESCRRTRGLVMTRGADVDALSSLSDSMASSSAESMLPESSGTSEV